MEKTNNKFISFFKTNYQKLIYTMLFALILISIFYAIIFMTDMYILSGTGYIVTMSFATDRYGIYFQASSVNNAIFVCALIMVILTALAFFMGNRKRSKYYISNFIFGFASSIASIALSIVVMLKTAALSSNIAIASYARMLYADGTSAGTSANIIIPEGFKETFNLGSVNGICRYQSPYLGNPEFTIERCSLMINMSFVLYTLIILAAAGVLAITITKLIKSIKDNKTKEVM